MLPLLVATAFADASTVQAATPSSAAAVGVGQLEGVITSPIDGRGLSGVDVVVRRFPVTPAGSPPGWSSATRTDPTGGFRFDALAPGLYSLDVLGVVPGAPAPGLVWTQVSPVVVVAGSTAVEQVVLRGAPPPAQRDT